MKTDIYHSNSFYSKYIYKESHILRGRLFFRTFLKYLEPCSEDKILDIGCNRGEIAKKVKKYSRNVTGIDINVEAVKRAVTSDIIHMDAVRMSFPSNYFDKIYSSHVIEHIPDLDNFIKGVERILKPGGKLLLVYPCEIFRGSNALIASIISQKNLFVARELHLHRLTPNRIKKLIAGTSLYHLKSKLHLVPSLSYFTLLEKQK